MGCCKNTKINNTKLIAEYQSNLSSIDIWNAWSQDKHKGKYLDSHRATVKSKKKHSIKLINKKESLINKLITLELYIYTIYLPVNAIKNNMKLNDT